MNIHRLNNKQLSDKLDMHFQGHCVSFISYQNVEFQSDYNFILSAKEGTNGKNTYRDKSQTKIHITKVRKFY